MSSALRTLRSFLRMGQSAATLPSSRMLATQAAPQPISTFTRLEPLVSSPFPTEVQTFLYDFRSATPLSLTSLPSEVFGVNPIRRDLLQRAVIWQRDGARQGNASTKGISDIRGSSRKQAPQKGRGKARMHSRRAPNFRGGATIFGPKPRDHSTGLQNKVYLSALRSALSAKLAQDQLTLVRTLGLPSKLSSGFRTVLDAFKWKDKEILMIGGGPQGLNRNLELASRNFPHIHYIDVSEADVLRVLNYDQVVLDQQAVAQIVERLSLD